MAEWTLPSSEGWSLMHDVALLYLTCMHGPDAEIDRSESKAVKEMLEARSTVDGAVDRVLDDVMLMYVGQSGPEMIATSIASLADALTVGQRKDLLREFVRIAGADGLVFESEVQLIAEIADRWGLGGALPDGLSAS